MKNIHILPTDKPSRLIIYSTRLNEFRLLNETIRDWKHKRHIYITNDEEIKEGDYGVLGESILSYHQMHKKWGMPQGKKIILTTDADLVKDGVQAIDDEFLEWFVKNPSCDEVEVGTEIWNDGSWNYFLPKEDSKQETFLGKTISKKDADKDSFEDVTKYKIERNYSEEEVEDIAKDAYAMGRKGILIGVFNKWFEQFKNK